MFLKLLHKTGHELTHGFDDSGREYDKYGMMHQWWNNKTIEDFEHASECIVNQYSEYSIGDEHLNGRQTLGKKSFFLFLIWRHETTNLKLNLNRREHCGQWWSKVGI